MKSGLSAGNVAKLVQETGDPKGTIAVSFDEQSLASSMQSMKSVGGTSYRAPHHIKELRNDLFDEDEGDDSPDWRPSGDKAKDDKAKGDKAKGDKAKGDKAKDDKAKDDKAKDDKAKGDKANGDKAKEGGSGKAKGDKAKGDKAKEGGSGKAKRVPGEVPNPSADGSSQNAEKAQKRKEPDPPADGSSQKAQKALRQKKPNPSADGSSQKAEKAQKRKEPDPPADGSSSEDERMIALAEQRLRLEQQRLDTELRLNEYAMKRLKLEKRGGGDGSAPGR
jgi:hypothetical protein